MKKDKRLMKEQQRLDKYKLQWPVDWTHNMISIHTIQKEIPLTIKVGMKYPFQHPKMYVYQMDYVEWFVQRQMKCKDLSSIIHVPCVCCRNILCYWTPSYGIENMIDDFLQFHSLFTLLDKFRIIYKKINGFDDLIYKNIISYLYNG
jgi:hypothetical protein